MDEPADWIAPEKDTRKDTGLARDRSVIEHERILEKRKRERLGLEPNEPLPESDQGDEL